MLREGPGRNLSAEVLVPSNRPDVKGYVLYLHGGGWCFWSAAHTRRASLRLAEAGYLVLNLNYALAPEHPFPQALEDVTYALAWLSQNGTRWTTESKPVVLAGDSAGANLAVGASLVANAFRNGCPDALSLSDLGPGAFEGRQDLESVEVAGLVLLYGIYDFPLLFAEPRGLATSGTVETTWNTAYLGGDFLSKHRHPLVSPARARNLHTLPRIYLSCGAEDDLLPQTLLFADVAVQSGVETTVSVRARANHEFLLLENDCANSEWASIFDWMKIESE
jgi:acetyl esterase